jgi:hypothetical protein
VPNKVLVLFLVMVRTEMLVLVVEVTGPDLGEVVTGITVVDDEVAAGVVDAAAEDAAAGADVDDAAVEIVDNTGNEIAAGPDSDEVEANTDEGNDFEVGSDVGGGGKRVLFSVSGGKLIGNIEVRELNPEPGDLVVVVLRFRVADTVELAGRGMLAVPWEIWDEAALKLMPAFHCAAKAPPIIKTTRRRLYSMMNTEDGLVECEVSDYTKVSKFVWQKPLTLSGNERLTSYRGQGQRLLVEEEKVKYEDVCAREEKPNMSTFIAGGTLAGAPSGEGEGLSLS